MSKLYPRSQGQAIPLFLESPPTRTHHWTVRRSYRAVSFAVQALLGALLVCAFVTPLCFGLSIDDGDSISLKLESTALWSNVADIATQGRFVFCAVGPGLQVFELEEDDSLSLVSQTMFSGAPTALTVQGDYLYAGLTDSSLAIVDISNVESPLVIRQLSLGDYVMSMAIEGNLVFVGCMNRLQIVDVERPWNPHPLDSFAIPQGLGHRVEDIEVSGDTCFLAAFDLWILDISNPSHIGKFSRIRDSRFLAFSLAKRDSLLFVGHCSTEIPAGESALTVFTVSDPWNPRRIGEYVFEGELPRLVVRGNLVYASAGSAGLAVFDLSDITSPQCIFHERQIGYFGDPIALAGNRLILGSRVTLWPHNVSHREACTGVAWYVEDRIGPLESWLSVYDISDPGHPVQVQSLDDPGLSVSVLVDSCFAYVAELVGGLSIVDLCAEPYPRRVRYVPLQRPLYPGDDYHGLAKTGNTLYVASSRAGLFTFDVSDPTNPQLLDSIKLATTFGPMKIVGNALYVTSGAGLLIADISTPSDPKPRGQFDLGASVAGLVVEGDRAYVAAGFAGGHLFDISDPFVPRHLLKFTETGGIPVDQIAVYHGLVAYSFVPSWRGFYLVDLSNPDKPSSTKTVHTDYGVSGLCFLDSMLATFAQEGGLAAYFLNDSSAPISAGTWWSPPEIWAPTGQGSELWAANRKGIFRYRLETPESRVDGPKCLEGLELDPAAPNPFDDRTIIRFRLSSSNLLEIDVINTIGQTVRNLDDRVFNAGIHEVTWDGRGSDGQSVASGVYFIVFRREGCARSSKVILLK